MGIFSLANTPSTQTVSVKMISSKNHDTSNKGKSIVDSTHLSHFEEIYQAIQSTNDPTINDHLLVASNPYHPPYWLTTPSLDDLLQPLPSDESIMEVMYLDEMHWKDRNHRSSFLPSYQMVEDNF